MQRDGIIVLILFQKGVHCSLLFMMEENTTIDTIALSNRENDINSTTGIDFPFTDSTAHPQMTMNKHHTEQY